jgi:hypothetical protein
VVLSAPAAARVDVEGSLLCDVLPDGTVAGQALVEAVYDTTSGDRVGTRTVVPATGATYAVQGTLQPCPPPEQCSCRTVLLCHTPDGGEPVPFLRHICSSCTGTATVTSTTLDGTTPYDTSAGTVGLCGQETAGRQAVERCGCDDADGDGIGEVRYVELWSVDTTDPDEEPLLLGTWLDGDFTQPYAPANPVDCPAGAQDVAAPIVLGQVCYDDGAGTVRTAAVVRCSGCGDPAVRYVDVATGAEVTAPVLVPCADAAAGGTDVETWQLCVVDDNSGNVLQNVRAEQVYDATGTAVGSPRIVDAVTGGPVALPGGTHIDVCPEPDPCASTVTTLRLCDLDPDTAPDSDGKRCAVPFLRHLVHDCTGALVETRNTTMDGVTEYAPVQVVDCGSGGVPAMVEVPWEVVDIQPDPDSDPGLGLVFSLSPIDDPATVGTVRVTTSSVYNPASCPGVPPDYQYRNPTRYTFAPDQVLQDVATYVRCDLIDFDTFEPVTGLTPPPSRLGGTAYWDGTTVRPTESNGTGQMFYDGPPAAWSYSVGNTGGGNSCSALSFAAVSLRAEGCCAPCGDSGSGGDSGRTVQEVCVIATAAPDEVMQWTRVIEDGGATIYYLDQTGARYDDTLPPGHQIVACATDPAPCHNSTTVLLCDAPASDTTTVNATITDSTAAASGTPSGWVDLPTPYTALWSGGTFNVAATAGPNADTRAATGVLTATLPAGCEAATATLNITATVKNNGPAAGQVWDGTLELLRGGAVIASAPFPTSAAAGQQFVRTLSLPVSLADLASGQLHVVMGFETYHLGAKSWTVTGFSATVDLDGCVDSTPVQFLRTLVTDCETGAVVSHKDTKLDGTDYVAGPDVGQCEPAAKPEGCTDCETLLLCDVPTTAPALITGTAASGTLSNGVGWKSTYAGSGANMAPVKDNASGSWWGMNSFPLPTTAPPLITFSRPVIAEFSVHLHYYATAPTNNSVQLAPGLEVVHLPDGYTYDASSGLLTRTSDTPADPCTYATDPQATTTARFRTPTAVTTVTTGTAPARAAVCGTFFTYWMGAVTAVPAGQFLRQICRDCDGTIVYVNDTDLDGTTAYQVAGNVADCQPDPAPVPEPCCRPVPLCIPKTVTETVHFISNQAALTDRSIDPVWSWRLETGDPDTWYPMYRGFVNGAWTLTDPYPDPAMRASWVDPHPDGNTENTGLGGAGEGPSIGGSPADPSFWIARATFPLPPDAFPDSIRVGASVLNGDQSVVAYQLNDGGWQTTGRDVGAAAGNYAPPAFGIDPATVIPGARPGTNTLYFRVKENVTGPSAGVMAHLWVDYERPTGNVRRWLQMVCCDNTTYYLDENGQRQAALPTGVAAVSCDPPETVVLCDDNGPFLRHLAHLGEQVSARDTTLDGQPYATAGTVTFCGGSGGAETAECDHCQTVLLADTAPMTLTFGHTAIDATPYTGGAPDAALDTPDAQQAWDSTDTTFAATAGAGNGQRIVAAARLTYDGCPPCGAAGLVSVRVCADFHNNGPTDAPAGTARFRVFNDGVHLASQAYPNAIPSGGAGVYCTSPAISVPLQDVIDGKIVATVDVETVDPAGAPRSWVVRQLRTVVTSEVTGCGKQFLTTICRDCAGTVTTVTHTELDGVTEYAPVGDVVAPIPPNPCATGGGTASSGQQLIERCGCSDEDGDGIAEVRYVELWSVDPDGTTAPILVGTYVDGDFDQPITPAAPMDCPAGGGDGEATAVPVLTGARSVTGTAPVDLAAEFPGLQSVTLLVSAGSVLASLTDGAAVPIPAGANVTWSVTRDQDAALDAASFAGADTGATFLLLWTYTA